MAFWKKRTGDKQKRAQQARDNLFLLLDENMARHCGRQEFWRGLHKLDAELVPGGISIEPFVPGSCRGITGADLSDQLFAKGKPTVVIQLAHERAACEGARLLNMIFKGCGAEFIPEVTFVDGAPHYQIRTNIDKQYWDKLCVFSQYRFEREIPEQERPALMAQCQQTVSEHVRDTPYPDWRSLEGVPAFITLMGQHGVLRAPERRARNKARDEEEMNRPHPRGIPLLFEGLKVHIELKGDTSEVAMTPYHYGFDADKSALEDATEGKSYLALLLETFGGNPFEKKIGLTSRSIAVVGLSFGLYGLSQGATDFVGWVGPAVTAGAAGTFVVATMIDHKWKILKKIDGIRKDSQKLQDLEAEYALPIEQEQEINFHHERYSQRKNMRVMEDPYTPSPLVHAVEALVTLDSAPRQGHDTTSVGR